jgi:phage terminase large subunit GpA-like protein
MQGDVWQDLDDLLGETYLHQSGAQLPISAAAMDTGGTAGMTQAAYEYARGKLGRRLFAIKGMGGWGRPIVTAPSRKRSGRGARPVDLFTVGVDEAKVVVQRRLGLEMPGPGYCHFPESRDPEYFHQLTAERLQTKLVKGFSVREWHKTRDRNEALDCRVYALAALKIMNPNVKRLVDRLAPAADEPEAETKEPVSRGGPRAPHKENPPEEPISSGDQDAGKRRKPRRKKRGGGWVNNW